MADKELEIAPVPVEIHMDPDDIVRALENNDERILTFVCQVVALAHSQELRERLLERLNPESWDDSEYV